MICFNEKKLSAIERICHDRQATSFFVTLDYLKAALLKADKIMKANENEPLRYTCTMHRDVVSDEPGNCPKCGMKLVPTRGNKMSGHMVLMLSFCVLPVMVVLLLPVFGVPINPAWVLILVFAGCCLLPMLFTKRAHGKK